GIRDGHVTGVQTCALPILRVMGFLFSVGCCCNGCDYFQDNFNRADGGPGADWSAVAGAWQISGNALTTSDANAILLCNTAAPHRSEERRVGKAWRVHGSDV